MPSRAHQPRIAIACGGTGGHLFPGLAVAECLWNRGAAITLLVSSKEFDRRALENERRFRTVSLPTIGFSLRRVVAFCAQSWRALRLARSEFKAWPPDAFLSMGGFTSAAPALAARRRGVPVLLHESNAIPGRANRWLSRRARRGYVYFPGAARRLNMREIRRIGMPVREQFQPADANSCRVALGLAPDRTTLLVMGGSQGASRINDLMSAAAPSITAQVPGLQIIHLTGTRDDGRVREAYHAAGITAMVRPFLTEMELALGSADVAVARAGASSIAELAAMRVPALLIPYPHAADDHQSANAQALEETGAARTLNQREATPARFASDVIALLADDAAREQLRAGLAHWHLPGAGDALAEDLLEFARQRGADTGGRKAAIEPAERATTP